MTTDGNIIVHVTRNELDNQLESRTYSWVGGRFAHLSHRSLADIGIRTAGAGGILVIGNLRLRVVDYEYDSRAMTVCLDGWIAWLLALLWPLTRWGQILRTRMILTAIVWGFGAIQGGDLITIGNLHIVRTVRAWRHRWNQHVKRLSE